MAAADHEFTKTEIKAGALVLASVLVLILFTAVIRGFQPNRDATKTYVTAFSNIDGLNVGADVRFGGLKSGKVTLITSDPEDRSRIRVEVEVGEQYPVNEGSVASVDQISLTAEKHLEISTGAADKPLLADGGFLAESAAGGGLFDLPDLEGVIRRIETLLDSVITIVGVENARIAAAGGEFEIVDATRITAALEAALNASGETARAVDATLDENREAIRAILQGLAGLQARADTLLQQVSGTIEENRAPLRATTANLQKLTEELSTEVENLAASLDVTLKNLQAFTSNSNDLLEQERITVEEILFNLQETTRNLKELSRTLADQPEALLLGKGRQGRVHKEKP